MAENADNSTFKNFIDKVAKQNNQTLAQLLNQTKDQAKIAEDDNKRAEQLDSVVESIKNLNSTITGQKISIDVQPMVDELGNQTKVLLKSLEELTLTRKISEGSLEYDRESAQYRNMSGRELESVVSGKKITKGGYIDFESAGDRLTGQASRARKANKLELTPISAISGVATGTSMGAISAKEKESDVKLSGVDLEEKDVTWGMVGKSILGKFGYKGGGNEAYSAEKEHYGKLFEREGYGSKEEGMKKYESILKKEEADKWGIKTKNVEADNIVTPDEALADTAKAGLTISNEQKDILIQQLGVLKEIKAALSPDVPAMLKEPAKRPSELVDEMEGKESTGIGLPDIGLPDRASKAKGKAGKAGKAGKLGRMAGKGLGMAAKVAGPLALAYGAYEVGSAAVNAGEYLGLEEGETPTVGQRIAAGAGALAETATFGLVNGRELGGILAQTPEGKKKALENQQAVGGVSIGEVGEFAGMDQMENVSPAPSKPTGITVGSATLENNVLKEARTGGTAPPQPIVSNNVTNTTKNNFVSMKPTPRANSSLDRYLDYVSVY